MLWLAFSVNLDPGLKHDIKIFKEMFMGTMIMHHLRMTPKVHVLVHQEPEYVRRTTAPLGPTSEQALESQHRFIDIFYHRERLMNAVLHYNTCLV